MVTPCLCRSVPGEPQTPQTETPCQAPSGLLWAPGSLKPAGLRAASPSRGAPFPGHCRPIWVLAHGAQVTPLLAQGRTRYRDWVPIPRSGGGGNLLSCSSHISTSGYWLRRHAAPRTVEASSADGGGTRKAPQPAALPVRACASEQGPRRSPRVSSPTQLPLPRPHLDPTRPGPLPAPRTTLCTPWALELAERRGRCVLQPCWSHKMPPWWPAAVGAG